MRASRIHRGLVGARQLVGTRYLADPGLRREYAAEIAPRTEAALAKVLAELFAGAAAPPRRVLDLGAGTGAVGTAVRDRFGSGTDVVAVDRVPAPGVVVTNLEVGLPRVGGSFDLVVAAHLLNELYLARPERERLDARARRVTAWAGLLAPAGSIVLIEPALRETSRALLGVRDRLLAAPGAALHVVAPCFWTGGCPALARDRDWCHDAVAPGGARAAGRPVDFSYLVLRAGPGPARPSPATMFRVVSDPLVEKGRLRLFGCGSAGRHALVRLDRHATAANAELERLARGDVAVVAGAEPAGDGLRVGPETAVRRQVPAEKSSL